MEKFIGFYFFPTIIGWERKDGLSILIVNLLLGWTIIGWIAVYFWASSKEAAGSQSLSAMRKPQPEPVMLTVEEETVVVEKTVELVA